MLLPPRIRRGGSRSVITSLTTITEEDEEQRSRRKKRRRGDSDSHLRGDEKKPLSRPDSTTPGHNTYIISSSTDIQNTGRPEALVLKLDERQRLARERREEREKQSAAREAQLLEREERARLYYEKQLEDRRRRLEEQRLKEDRRRAAVEEKRRQKLEEEKARYEAVVRKTLEKSQRVRPKQNRWSWGGTLTSSTSHNSGFDDSALLFTLDLAGLECGGVFSPARQQRLHTQYADRRSVSTMNLSKHIDPVINKRLSSSSATLLNSPDRGLQKQTSLSSSCLVNKVPSKARASREKIHQDRPAGMRRMPLTPWESNVVSRLQTPTHSYLARSRSAVSLSGDAASCHQTSSLSIKALQSRSTERPIRAGLSLERAVRAAPDGNTCRKAAHAMLVDRKDKDYVRKSWSNLSCPMPTLNLTTTKRAPSPGSQRTKVSQPSSARSSTKPPQKSPMSKRSRSPPPPRSSMPLSPSNPSLLPGNLRPSRVTSESPRVSLEDEKDLKEEEEAKREETEGRREEDEEAKQEKKEQNESPAKEAAEISTRKAESNGVERVASPPAVRVSAGTTDPEEASRLLAEKRRQAREQREKEEEEKRQQEEAERRHREEMARKIAEERAKREEEAQRLAEEKKRKEEEERRLEEERLQREKEEEAERLQRQKEEEEARQREEAERLRQEREKHFQKEEAERLERKKRLEEIMKRTRRSDQKSPGQRNGDVSQQSSQDTVNVVPGIPSITVSAPQNPHATQHSDSNGHTNPDLNVHTLPPAGHNTEAQLQENGVVMETPAFEEVIEVPMVTKLSRQEGDGEEEDERRKTPLLAFRENGSTHDLSTWEQSQVQHHAGDV
ncbi:ensconsin isoform X2 [Pangasianodon hypophthalmus]|uniref:ensconsin isoform X2 n=1 Tax=Pangasianodon hypophthalmus TaxID=310915 RepID=UPI002307659A|nr:ensconsin isoform X2 [Pangasianodon hypophthalmus]